MSSNNKVQSAVPAIKKIRVNDTDQYKTNMAYTSETMPYAKMFHHNGVLYAVGAKGAFYCSEHFWHDIYYRNHQNKTLVWAMMRLGLITDTEWEKHNANIHVWKMQADLAGVIEAIAQLTDNNGDVTDNLVTKAEYMRAIKAVAVIRKKIARKVGEL